jgi:hypothetical protein
MNGATVAATGNLGTIGSNWTIVNTGDFDGNRTADILWRDTTGGTTAIWFMSGLTTSSAVSIATVSTNWVIQGTNAN